MLLLETLGQSVSLLFPVSSGCLSSLTCGASNCITPTSASIITSSLTLIFPSSFTYKDPFDYVVPTQTIQNNLPISRSLTYSHLQSPFLSYKVTYTGSGDKDVDLFGELLCCLPYLMFQFTSFTIFAISEYHLWIFHLKRVFISKVYDLNSLKNEFKSYISLILNNLIYEIMKLIAGHFSLLFHKINT